MMHPSATSRHRWPLRTHLPQILGPLVVIFVLALIQRAEGEAHKLFGSLGIFGMKRASALAGRIEELLDPVACKRDQLPELVDRLITDLERHDS